MAKPTLFPSKTEHHLFELVRAAAIAFLAGMFFTFGSLCFPGFELIFSLIQKRILWHCAKTVMFTAFAMIRY